MDLQEKKYADPKSHKFGSAPYYIAEHKGHMYYYLTAAALTSIFGSEVQARRYKKAWRTEGD
jgi:hypothetical protein